MFSKKYENMELTSSLIQRPSVSSAPDVPSNYSEVENVPSWIKIFKDRKIYILIFGAFLAIFVWIALLSLQLYSLRRTMLHSDEIDGLRSQILDLKGD